MRKSELAYAAVFLLLTAGLLTGAVPGGASVGSLVRALDPIIHRTARALGLEPEKKRKVVEKASEEPESEAVEETYLEDFTGGDDGILPGTGEIEMIRGTERSFGQPHNY